MTGYITQLRLLNNETPSAAPDIEVFRSYYLPLNLCPFVCQTILRYVDVVTHNNFVGFLNLFNTSPPT